MTNYVFKMDVYQLYFKISNIQPSVGWKILNFRKKLTQYIFDFKKRKGSNITKRGGVKERKPFYIDTRTGMYHYPISILKTFLAYCQENSIPMDKIALERHRSKPCKIKVKMKKGWVPRENQVECIDFIMADGVRKLMDLPTGYGKSFIATYAISKLKQRTVVVVLPRYMEKWKQDFLKMLDVSESEILLISGKDHIRAINDGTFDVSQYKFFILSNRTLQKYIKQYEKDKEGDPYAKSTDKDLFEETYKGTPEEFFRSLNTSVMLVDEVHQEFHSQFRVAITNPNVEKYIALSATLLTKDTQLNKFYNLLLPPHTRYSKNNKRKHLVVVPVRYMFKYPRYIKTYFYGNPNYNHTAFEQSIIKNSRCLKNYLDMIYYYVKIGYLDRKKPGEKLAIFMASIELCSITVKYLKKKIKEDLDIVKYTQEDPYDNVLNSDIRVTTVLSAGTLVDIKGLITVIQTVNILSIQANIQVAGRLRRIEDRETIFYYLYAGNIDKHVAYHMERLNMFKDRAKRISSVDYPNII